LFQIKLLREKLRNKRKVVTLAELIPCRAPIRLLGVNRGRQNEERKALRGEPFSAEGSAFAGPGVPSLSGHVADLFGFFA